MIKKPNPLQVVVEEVLAAAGFSRRGSSWHRRNAEVVEVVNLQKSQYGDKYYLNYGLWLLQLGDARLPGEAHCHVRMRVEVAISDELGHLLDLETEVPEPQRREQLRKVLNQQFLPFADRCRSVNDARSCFKEGRLRRAMILAPAKKILSG